MFLTNLIHYEPVTHLSIDHFKHRKVQTCHKTIMPFDPFLPETVVITWRHIMRLPLKDCHVLTHNMFSFNIVLKTLENICRFQFLIDLAYCEEVRNVF